MLHLNCARVDIAILFQFKPKGRFIKANLSRNRIEWNFAG